MLCDMRMSYACKKWNFGEMTAAKTGCKLMFSQEPSFYDDLFSFIWESLFIFT